LNLLVRRRALAALVASSLAFGAIAEVHAQTPDSAKIKEAGSHFERGATLYKEADYRGALAEFRRALDLAPNPTVRFNVGQALYQLRDYPGALQTFEAYLSEAAPDAPNRAEAEGAVAQLRTRVGTLKVTGPAGADLLVSDESVGHLPLAPLRVSVGSHKVTLVPNDGPRVTRTVDVVGGGTVDVAFDAITKPAATATSTGPTPPPEGTVPPAPPPPPATSSDGPRGTTIALWVATGVFAAGAVTTGVIAQTSSSKLTDLKKSEGTTRADLDKYHDRMRTFAVTTDILTGVAVVAGAAALYVSLSPDKPATASGVEKAPTRIGFGLGSLQLSGAF
jgi:hypothetical protein